MDGSLRRRGRSFPGRDGEPLETDADGLGITVFKVASMEDFGLTTETRLVKAALLYAAHVTLLSANAIHLASGGAEANFEVAKGVHGPAFLRVPRSEEHTSELQSRRD